MAAQPTFSVIVAAYESADRISLTVHSALGQTRGDLELVVVDDGSRDGTAEVVDGIAQHDQRLRLIRQQNEGTVSARNHGLREARGAFVSFLDDDDLWLPTYLERVGGAMESNPAAGIGTSDAWVMDAQSGRVGSRSAWERFAVPIRRLPNQIGSDRALRSLLRVNFLSTCATTVSREALSRVGPLDPTIKGADDWDLWLRIAGAGFEMVRVSERLAVTRKRPDSVGADAVMMASNSAKTLESAIGRGMPRRAVRVAGRHLRVIELERRSSHARSALAGRLARRLGRKRLPARGGAHGRWEQPPPQLRQLLGAVERDIAEQR